MRKIVENVLAWFIRHFFSFLVIVAILAGARVIQNQFQEFESVTSEYAGAQASRQELEKFIAEKTAELTGRVGDAGRSSLDQLGARIERLGHDIERRKAEQKKIARPASFLKGDIGKRATDYLKAEVEINLLEQELNYLKYAYGIGSDILRRQAGEAELARLHQIHQVAYRLLQENKAQQAALKSEHHTRSKYEFWSKEYKRLRDLKEQEGALSQQNDQAAEAYNRQKVALDGFKIPAELRRFALEEGQIKALVQPFDQEIEALSKRYDTSFVKKVADPINNVWHTAFFILLSIILAPVLIKVMAYFVIAPLAARRPPIQVLREMPGCGAVGIESNDLVPPSGKASAVSQTIEIQSGEELLVHPEYIQSTSVQGSKDTKWLLDWAYPLSSLASGMTLLTRFRTTGCDSIVISATRDPLSEVGVISVPEGQVIVLQPHNLVGVAQDQRNPVRITSHWRLGSLQAWLTLQLRYLAFHGPARLVVKGCRGIGIERAGAGRSINQAATIGFSANTLYSTRRCETFTAYFLGKQELFNDCFEGSAGYYIYEESPNYGSKSGFVGRGIEGALDSLLKVFGV